MIFLLSKELWQTVRHCARRAEMQSDLWYWTGGDFGGDVRLRSINGDTTLSTLIAEASRLSRASVSIVAASPGLSQEFENLIGWLVRHDGDLRISLMLTSPLDEREAERCREFLRENHHLQSRVSTFFLAGRLDSELNPLDAAEVSGGYTTFLRLLCQGGESLADELGIFRSPHHEAPEESDELQIDRFSTYSGKGIVAVLGLSSWIPSKEKIVQLTESLFAKMVAEEEKRAAIGVRIRTAGPSPLIHQALYLGQADEPLASEDFADQIPEPPPSPLEDWSVPVSKGRARQERRHLQRVVQRDFSDYTEALKKVMEEITAEICEESTGAFSQAASVYRGELLQGIDMGSLSLLVRNYYPEFDTGGEAVLAGPDQESKGWVPHQSMDCFCHVYDTLEEGLEQLPTSRVWKASAWVAFAFLLAASLNWNADLWVPVSLGVAGLLSPGLLWLYRALRLRKLRKELVAASKKTFEDLIQAFDAEVKWVLHQTRVQLERDIRKDATMFGRRLQDEFDSIAFLSMVGGVDRDGLNEEIRQLRAALLGIGVDENKLEHLSARLEDLARKIVRKAGQEVLPEGETPSDPTPAEIVEEWLDELVGTSVLPLAKVAKLKDEILNASGAWRMPSLMAPLTDAELHKGFRKVVVLPDTDIIYQHLQESLPNFSGNPVVSLDVWSGSVPGVAVCSVVSGLTESILDYQVKPSGNGTAAAGPNGEGGGNGGAPVRKVV